MATTDAKVAISVERVAHDAFHDVAKQIYEEYGVLVGDVRFYWQDRGTMSQPKMGLHEVTINSTTRAKS